MGDYDFYKIYGANDQLRGTVAFVHPKVVADPLGKRNQVGVICEADVTLDNIYVDFVDKVGLFSAEALLVFLPDDVIHQNLAEMPGEVPFPDLKALTQIDLFLRYGDGTVNARFKALAIARDNPAIQDLCVETLNNQISRDIPNQYCRD